MEQKLLTAVVQYAQQMLYFGKQRVERQIGEMRMMGAQMERERKKERDLEILSFEER